MYPDTTAATIFNPSRIVNMDRFLTKGDYCKNMFRALVAFEPHPNRKKTPSIVIIIKNLFQRWCGEAWTTVVINVIASVYNICIIVKILSQ